MPSISYSQFVPSWDFVTNLNYPSTGSWDPRGFGRYGGPAAGPGGPHLHGHAHPRHVHPYHPALAFRGPPPPDGPGLGFGFGLGGWSERPHHSRHNHSHNRRRRDEDENKNENEEESGSTDATMTDEKTPRMSSEREERGGEGEGKSEHECEGEPYRPRGRHGRRGSPGRRGRHGGCHKRDINMDRRFKWGGDTPCVPTAAPAYFQDLKRAFQVGSRNLSPAFFGYFNERDIDMIRRMKQGEDVPGIPTAAPADSQDYKPEADVFDTESSFIIHVSLPGAKKEDVGVNWDAEKSELSIAGVVHRPGDEEFLKTLATGERWVGPFERKVRLGSGENPAMVDADSITAKLEDGVLRVEVPKLDRDYVEVRRVDVL